MAENVKVIVRCRPMNKKEQDMNCQCVVKMRNCVVETWDPSEGPSFPKQFTFDSTYDQDSTTEAIYNDICYPLVESVLEGYNATIFVYGQTGCGKSHTMEGQKSDIPEKGVISRAFEHIFEAISVTTGVKYLALISYLEIYNEQIRDLLLPNDKITASALNLKESPTEGVTVPGLTSHPVHNASECEHFLSLGSKNRIIGATLMNQNSSRSHSIFTISIEQITNINNNESLRKGKLNLVDLAGSERQAKTGATGDRLKEATKINLSLSALGNVISALVDGKAKHIPYRDSKLTRLLQDSLGGNTRTLMIACVSPSSRDYVETLSTLRYANRAKNIHNKPIVNEDPKDTMLRQYQEEIERLKNLLGSQQLKIEEVSVVGEVEEEPPDLDARRDRLIQEYQQEMEKLKNLHENEKHEKENVLKQIQSIKEEYEQNIQKLNSDIQEKKQKELCSKEEILGRIEALKKAMIGGEKANDQELSERRKRKKMAAERRASVIAHLLAKIDMNEDREILHNQYKDISQELNLKTEALRRYRHKVKSLEKEISDIQSEFETERQDYLETIRKQDQNIKLLSQVAEKMASTMKKECNYSDLETIKEEAVWLEESQRYKLPEVITPRTKLPPPGRLHDIQTAPARLQESFDEELYDRDFLEKNHNRMSAGELEKLEKSEKEDIIGSYFAPTTKRAAELLSQSSRLDANRVFNTWRGSVTFTDFARRNKPKSTEDHEGGRPGRPPNLSGSFNNLWLNGAEGTSRKPLRLEALPNIDSHRSRNQRLNSLDFL